LAIEPQAPPEKEQLSPIENEIPAYRAISPMAIGSLVLGLISALSFADTTFLAASILAVAAGIYAQWKIRKMPDVLTGRGFAQAGIALGLIFGLASVTNSAVTDAVVRRGAAAFSKEYAEVLSSGSLAQALHYKVPAEERKSVTPEEVLKQMTSAKGDPGMIESQTASIRGVQARLKEPGTHLSFADVEATGFDGLSPVAATLLDLHGPATKDHKAEEHVLLEIKAEGRSRPYQWHLKEVHYPYVPKSYKLREAPVDDGHGHGGHGH